MKKSKLLLVSGILGTAYVAYLLYYFFGGAIGDATTATLATAVVAPHMVMVILSVIFTWLGYFFSKRWAALVAGILYCVACLFMFIYIPFVLVQLVLSFVAFSKMKAPKV